MDVPYGPEEFPDRADVLRVVSGQAGGLGERREGAVVMATAVPCSIQEYSPADLLNALGAIGSKESAIAYFPRESLRYVPVPGDRLRDVATGRVYTVVRTIDEAGAGLLWAVHLASVA